MKRITNQLIAYTSSILYTLPFLAVTGTLFITLLIHEFLLCTANTLLPICLSAALAYICSFRAVRNADFGLCSVWSTSCPAFATSKISHSTLCSKIKFIFHFINSYCNFMNNLLCYPAACCFLCIDP